MADLIAQGARAHNRWRRTLAADEEVVVGRAADTWSAFWDEKVSRRHAKIRWSRNVLTVERLEGSRNPIFFHGQEAKKFDVRPGESFVIGDTMFTLTAEDVRISEGPAPFEELTFAPRDLQQVRYRDADHRLDVLSKLPEVISGATNEHELFLRLGNMILAGVPNADGVAFVKVDLDIKAGSQPTIMHWDRRRTTGSLSEDDFRPSRRLITEAVRDRQQSVLHVWQGTNSSRAAFTVQDDADWAFCTPVPRGATEGWGIYVTGRITMSMRENAGGSVDVRDDLKFTELVANILSSLLQVRRLQKQHATYSQFFSKVLLDSMGSEDPDQLLRPRETEVSVLFCDLRGFSREAERSRSDLLGLLNRVSQALGVMTHAILDQGGVIGDFQGDAAMGFWGWPIASPDAAVRACRAALQVRSAFESAAADPANPLADFRMGIGIATGRAVAGRIGTVDQGKVSVFGPVVNLASRMEGMTKILQAPILIDETTARQVRNAPPDVLRLRRVGVFKPYGMEEAVVATEIVPPVAEHPELSDKDITQYEAALDAFLKGDWSTALRLLYQTSPDDRVKDFLTIHIAQHGRVCPPNWDRVVPLTTKN